MSAAGRIGAFLEAQAAELDAAKNTQLAYARDLRDFADWLDRRGLTLDTAARADVEAYLVALRRAGTGRRDAGAAAVGDPAALPLRLRGRLAGGQPGDPDPRPRAREAAAQDAERGRGRPAPDRGTQPRPDRGPRAQRLPHRTALRHGPARQRACGPARRGGARRSADAPRARQGRARTDGAPVAARADGADRVARATRRGRGDRRGRTGARLRPSSSPRQARKGT